MAWGSLWGLFGGSGRKYGALSNVWKSCDFHRFFEGWRVSGGTWKIALGGLGCTLAACLLMLHPAAWLDGQRVVTETPGAEDTRPVEGKMVVQGG